MAKQPLIRLLIFLIGVAFGATAGEVRAQQAPPGEAPTADRAQAQLRQAVSTARRYSEAGLTLRALEVLRPFQEGTTADAALAESSRILFAAKDYPRAATGYRRLLERHPGTFTVQRNLLLALYRSFLDEEARTLLEEMGDAAATDSRALTVKGLLAVRVGDLRTAVRDFEKATALGPEDPQAPYEHGLALLSLGDATAAVAALREAVARAPDFSHAHYNLGLALLRAGETERGQASLARARELTAKTNERRTRIIRAIALSRRAQEALSKGDPAAAVQDLQEATALHPEEPQIRTLLQEALAALETSSP